MTAPVLDVRDLSVEFHTDTGVVQAVNQVSFQVQPGQTLGIVGESGSGKSVSCLAAMRLIPTPPGRIVQGEIWFQGRGSKEPVDLLSLSPEQVQPYRGGQMGMIFQEPMSSLNPVYTCGFQIMEAIQQHDRISKSEAQRRAVNLLQEVKLLSPDEDPKRKLNFLKRYPHELSGGQIQRIMIAIALSCNPSLLIADEPTTALDVTVQATILRLLQELGSQREMALIFVSHDLGVIAEIADTVAVMYQGKIVESGTAIDIFNNPQHPYTKGLLACRPRLDQDLVYLPTVADFMNSEFQTNSELRTPNSEFRIPNSELLKVQNLCITFPIKGVLGQVERHVEAVKGVSFEVFQGETLGLVGESGCGKTTLARSLLRLIQPRSGQIIFQGENLVQASDRRLRQLRRDMQIIFQNPYGSLNPRMSVGEAVMEPMLIHGFNKRSKSHRDRAVYLLERVGLEAEAMSRYPHAFSGGQRQRICIARALALNPRFIICDESVSALDVSVQAQVLNLLKELQQEFGLTYIFISHDLSVVKFMSDRIMVMNQGQIEEIASAASLYTNPQKEYTRQLIAAIPTGEVKRSTPSNN
jgi:peptide/nickel transport system ATP-binding protein